VGQAGAGNCNGQVNDRARRSGQIKPRVTPRSPAPSLEVLHPGAPQRHSQISPPNRSAADLLEVQVRRGMIGAGRPQLQRSMGPATVVVGAVLGEDAARFLWPRVCIAALGEWLR
jgi:hypothetical protein